MWRKLSFTSPTKILLLVLNIVSRHWKLPIWSNMFDKLCRLRGRRYSKDSPLRKWKENNFDLCGVNNKILYTNQKSSFPHTEHFSANEVVQDRWTLMFRLSILLLMITDLQWIGSRSELSQFQTLCTQCLEGIISTTLFFSLLENKRCPFITLRYVFHIAKPIMYLSRWIHAKIFLYVYRGRILVIILLE